LLSDDANVPRCVGGSGELRLEKLRLGKLRLGKLRLGKLRLYEAADVGQLCQCGSEIIEDALGDKDAFAAIGLQAHLLHGLCHLFFKRLHTCHELTKISGTGLETGDA
jgi:hypothetical protein